MMARRTARGFTLLETVLASVVGSMVLLACFSLFLAMSRTEKSMSRASRHMEELALTQQVLRKSFMTMVLIGEQTYQSAVSEVAIDGVVPESARPELPRPRLIVGFDDAPSINAMMLSALQDGVELQDPAGYGAGPYRIEVVLPGKPLPESMRLFPPAWSTGPSDDLVAAFDPSGIERPDSASGVRGVYELRPDGARERVMEGYGIVPATGLQPRPLTPAARTPAEGWTLWWRPVYGAEYQARQYGEPYDPDANPTLLEEAVPLVRGIETMRVYAFASEENPEDPEAPLNVQRWPEYESSTTDDLPGYLEFEIRTTSGHYVSWIFELGWSIAEETITDSAAGTDDGTGTQQNGTQGGQNTQQGGQQGGQQNGLQNLSGGNT